ncbi:hypothetical protein TIFTF001_017168 [Ficus carica]|uniref:Uncharacterized protein n=1 Tax=Ficus carica TaxID=3494 RepID=A0AA88D6R9_FICCA|nr:hypothetical protein TIFTF001_017168 [Ficus carica]
MSQFFSVSGEPVPLCLRRLPHVYSPSPTRERRCRCRCCCRREVAIIAAAFLHREILASVSFDLLRVNSLVARRREHNLQTSLLGLRDGSAMIGNSRNKIRTVTSLKAWFLPPSLSLLPPWSSSIRWVIPCSHVRVFANAISKGVDKGFASALQRSTTRRLPDVAISLAAVLRHNLR